MRLRIAVLLAVASATPAAPLCQTGDNLTGERARVIAALERLMQTGEPHDTEHGEGAWLQASVDAAFVVKDQEIIRLAQRAAAPLLAYVATPVSTIHDMPGFGLRHAQVLKLPRPVRASAELFVSLDGGEFVPAGPAPPAGSSRSLPLPPGALAPGAHHLRLLARIVYRGTGEVPPAETRNLPELTYAVYDPARPEPGDARMFIRSPLAVSARQLDPDLPDEPFGPWLQRVLAAHAATAKLEWFVRYCNDRIREHGAPTRTRHLCSVGSFVTGELRGHVWIRTGRIELTETAVQWIPETPAFEALALESSSHTEFDRLAELPSLLATHPSQLPVGDVSVAPEDIHVTPVDGPDGPHVRISAIVRNSGFADVRGVQVLIAATVDGPDGSKTSVIVNVPRRGQTEIVQSLPFSAPYGLVFIHAMQLSEHAPAENFQPDPTPEDAIAFRIVNPKRAPAGYAAKILKDCAGVCRGY